MLALCTSQMYRRVFDVQASTVARTAFEWDDQKRDFVRHLHTYASIDMSAGPIFGGSSPSSGLVRGAEVIITDGCCILDVEGAAGARTGEF